MAEKTSKEGRIDQGCQIGNSEKAKHRSKKSSKFWLFKTFVVLFFVYFFLSHPLFVLHFANW